LTKAPCFDDIGNGIGDIKEAQRSHHLGSTPKKGSGMKATTSVGIILALAGLVFSSTVLAQTNNWISPTRGYWEDYTKWDLDVAPSNSQSVYITNDVSKTVTIDSITSGAHPDTMTVSNLYLSAPDGAINALELSSAGKNSPLQILDTFVISSGGSLYLSNSAVSMTVVSTNSITNGVMSVDGLVMMDTNSLLTLDDGLYVGVDTNATGVVHLAGGQIFLTNAGPSAVGINAVGQLIVSNGNVQTAGFVFVGSGAGSQGTLTLAGGNYQSLAFGHLTIGMETGSVGTVSVTGGNLIANNTASSNSFMTIVGGDGSGQLNLLAGTNVLSSTMVGGDPGSQGTITMAAGVTTLQGPLQLGSSLNATGTFWMIGGQLTQTNIYVSSSRPNNTNYFPSCLGSWGVASLIVSNGKWSGGAMVLGVHSNSVGTVSMSGGSMTLLSELLIGYCPSGGVGVVTVAGGSLYVTNAAHNASIEVRQGQLNLNGGLLQTDVLIMTNTCGLFAKGGGTLIVGSLVLDPNLSALGDGIPNGWKQQYGFNPLDPAVANADSDGDGLSNLQEFLAGTDPTNSASSVRITSMQAIGNDLRIAWSVVTGKTYAVELATNTVDGSYVNAFANLATVAVSASPSITETNYLDTGAVTNGVTRYYRIRLITP
jgi:hypothetical protein